MRSGTSGSGSTNGGAKRRQERSPTGNRHISSPRHGSYFACSTNPTAPSRPTVAGYAVSWDSRNRLNRRKSIRLIYAATCPFSPCSAVSRLPRSSRLSTPCFFCSVTSCRLRSKAWRKRSKRIDPGGFRSSLRPMRYSICSIAFPSHTDSWLK